MTRNDQNEGRGGPVSDTMNVVCENSPLPCLILDGSRTVVAANDGACRMTLRSREAGSPNMLIGKTIGQLGFIAVLTKSSKHQDVEALLDDYPLDRQQKMQRTHVEDSHHESEADFWDQEDQRAYASLEIVVPREIAVRGQTTPFELAKIRARMSLRYLQCGSDLMYMITFDRPRSGKSSFASQDRTEKLELSNNVVAENRSGQAPAPAPAQELRAIVNKAIPYTTATFDLDGRALEFSKTWYDFFETTEHNSLGTKWFNVLHPEDIEILVAARTKAIKHNENTWDEEVRYRTKDDSYRWSVIRATSSRDESGRITSWYASMMDIDELLRSRQEAEYWRGSIMTLAANADVCLWGLTADGTLFIKEGSLSWDPTVVLGNRSEEEAFVQIPEDHPQVSSSINSVEGAVKAVSGGRLAALRLEHTNSDRWYQSTLVVDYCHHTNRGSDKNRPVLGLTIDTTDARARAKLETENASLVNKEKVAKGASESKSRFLANVRYPLPLDIRLVNLF